MPRIMKGKSPFKGTRARPPQAQAQAQTGLVNSLQSMQSEEDYVYVPNMTGAKRDSRDVRDLLEDSRHVLVQRLNVVELLPKFRQERFMNHEDEELIRNEYRHPTSSEKAGCFLDKVLRGDPQGMTFLIDHLEAEHPDLYKEVTGQEAKMSIKRAKTIIDRSKTSQLPGPLAANLLNYMTETIQRGTDLEEALKKKTEDLVKQDHDMRNLLSQLRQLKRDKNDLIKDRKERDKLKGDMERLRLMLQDSQDRVIRYQKEAEVAKHHARLATFKNFHLECQLKESQSKFAQERRQTKHLQQSVKKREVWMKEHKATFFSDRQKVEELQTELEKIDNIRDSGSGLSDRIKNQLNEAHLMNESLSMRLHSSQEKVEQQKNELVQIKNRQKMMKDTMQMNRKHLEMAQRELEIVSSDQAQVNHNFIQLYEKMAQAVIERNDLQQKLNKLRIQCADSSLAQHFQNDSDSLTTTGVYSDEGDDADDDGDNDDDDDDIPGGDDDAIRAIDSDHLNTSDGSLDKASDFAATSSSSQPAAPSCEGEDAVLPMPRRRARRLDSQSKMSMMGRKKSREDSFEEPEAGGAVGGDTGSLKYPSSSTTTGDEEDSFGQIFSASTDNLAGYEGVVRDLDLNRESMAIRLSQLEHDFEFYEDPSVMLRGRPNHRRGDSFGTRRRSRSLSRLEEYEAFDAMPISCMSGFKHFDSMRRVLQRSPMRWMLKQK
ncbi:uncharacterized protein [Diadema antillarum]|uniref:uncharacterized protein n=1 Tax=Diadema antillarum TaxID=105358 RepID=UPI003A8BB996